jgi:protein TonB
VVQTASPAISASSLPAAEGLDADGLRGYRVALAREARRFKRYPKQAIDAGWEGTAEIKVAVLAGGVAQDAQIARSSGHRVLDDAALEMLTNALSVTPVPPILLGRSFAVSLPVVFEVPAE